VSGLSKEKKYLLERLLAESGIEARQAAIHPRDAGRPAPLSFAQERLWFLSQLDPGSPAYNITFALPISVPLDLPALQKALQGLVRRHEILRTTFPAVDGVPVQNVGPATAELPEVLDLSLLPAADRQGRVDQLMASASAKPFDLANGPILHLQVIRRGDNDHILLVSLHHIAIDGWSLGILFRDLFALYGEASGGPPASLPPLPIQFGDFAEWQRRTLQSEALNPHLDYWRKRLAELSVLQLPTDRPRPKRSTFRGAGDGFLLQGDVARAIRDISRRDGLTLYTTLLATFKILLARYTGRTDIVVGSPIANRDRPEVANLIGFFVNMLVLRTELAGVSSFREVLRRVRSTVLEGFAHQQVPFEKLVLELSPQREPGLNPLFQVTFALDSTPPIAPPETPPGALGTLGVPNQTTRFDLEAVATELPDALLFSLVYSVDLFDAATIRRMMEEWRVLLEEFAANPDQPLTVRPTTSEAYLTNVEFLNHLRLLDIKIWLEDDKLRVSAPPGVLTGDLKAELGRRKQDLLELLRPARATKDTAISLIPRDGELPVSLSQQRLWFLDRLDPGNITYNIAGACRLPGPLNREALGRAVSELIARHESLRTTFVTVDGAPRVRINAPSTQQLEVVDLRWVAAGEREKEAQRRTTELACRPFDLARGPLFRAALIQLSDSDQVFCYSMHHIVSDGWSVELFSRELALLYSAFASGQSSPLAPLPVQYVDFAHWQQLRLEGGRSDEQLQYWTRQLQGRLPVMHLPTDRPRPPVQSFRGQRTLLRVPAALTDALKELSRREGSTLFITLLAAFKVLLHRYTGEVDVIVGSPTSNRGRPELENVIGFFVNNLVLRSDLSGNPTFRELLGRVRRVMLNAHANQDMPFDRLVDVLRPDRDVSHSPLFQVMFNSPMSPLERPPGDDAEQLAIAPQVGAARFDLTIEYLEERLAGTSLAESKTAGLKMYFEFNTDLFDGETIQRMQGHYIRLLEGIIRAPEERISVLPLLPPEETRKLLVDWNATQADYDRSQCIHRLFEEQARRTPDAVAVDFDDERTTYQELDRRANRLARHLQGLGIQAEKLVGICLDRTTEMVVAVLAVLKAGGAYVPLDPTYPADRLRYMVDDSGLRVLVTEDRLRERIPGYGYDRHAVSVDGDRDLIAKQSADPLNAEVASHHRAYLIYTSGSTGKPKGVEIEHRSVANFLAAMRKEPGLSASDRLLSVTTLSFDIAGLELYLPLTVGATIVLASRDTATDAGQLMDLISRSRATVMQATPATWRLLVEAGWNGSSRLKVLCGGESLPRDLAEQILPRVRELWNMYGPTEATIWCTVHRVTSGTGPISIGRPIANMQAYVLDGSLHPVPIGVTGELWLGGDGLARGYLHRPELTAERFVPDPFAPVPDARLYRTGDLVRFHRDGTIEWLGRADGQTKIRGFRIELGEIETALAEFPGIRQAVVVVREASAGDQRLAAYLLPAKSGLQPDLGAVAMQLKSRLPEYMIPSSYTVMESFPLTPNGKVDRRALPAPDNQAGQNRPGYVPPGTETERAVASVWSEVLGVEKVGLHDSFFDLGGHSLLIVRVHSRLEKQVPNPPSLVDLFQYPTVAALADRLDRGATVRSFDQARERAQRQLQA
jgi:amino acid adenylation domain-containing protein